MGTYVHVVQHFRDHGFLTHNRCKPHPQKIENVEEVVLECRGSTERTDITIMSEKFRFYKLIYLADVDFVQK
jgi:hypothetical protein